MARYINLDNIEPFRSSFYLSYFRKVLLEVCPVEDVKPVVHAYWIEEDDGWGNSYYSCSNCREPWDLIDGTPEDNRMNYCPTCGAIMDEKTLKKNDYSII